MAWVVCWALLLTSYSTTNAQTVTLDPAQVYSTGNLTTFESTGTTTTSSWQNVGQWGGSLTCWAPGGPGYCGPQPYVNSNGYGNINFSYGYTDLYQLVNIAAALPNSGTGLRVNGFNFGFQAKNGNGWDGGGQDYLAAYVSFYGSDGKLTQHYDYSAYTNRLYNWTYFNFSETFATPYASKDLSTARYGFVGYDTNYWAGPYGPEVNSVSFSLKYSVDPCYVDVLSSPTCPGYLDAIAKLTPPATATTEPVTTVATTTSTTQSPATASSTTPTSDPAQPSSGSTATVSTATTSVAPTATNPQPRVGEITVTGSAPTTSKSSVSTSQILSIVRNEQNRIGNLETATAAAAVQQAQQAGTQAATLAESVAAQQQASVQSASQQVSMSQPGSRSAGPGQFGGIGNFGVASSVFGTVGRSDMYSLATNSSLPNASVSASSRSTWQESSTAVEVAANTALTNPTNPLANVLNPAPIQPAAPQASTGPAVNREVRDNDAAGGVSLASMTRQPVGFELYMSSLGDRPFYPVREAYPGQRVVDNARVLRGLQGGSDRVHQQMVDQQYNNNKGN